MDSYGSTWAVVIAGGDGRRLRASTPASKGITVPAQCGSPWDTAGLLKDALRRGAAVAPLRLTCIVVAAPHRRWWSTELAHVPDENVIVQPQNRGTGIGILISLMYIVERDPHANVMVIPADHYTQDGSAMAISLRAAADLAADDTDAVYLLGEESLSLAHAALWSVFIIAGSVSGLLRMYRRSHDDSVSAMGRALVPGKSWSLDRSILLNLYEHITPIDFSQDVLEGQEQVLRVLPVLRREPANDPIECRGIR